MKDIAFFLQRISAQLQRNQKTKKQTTKLKKAREPKTKNFSSKMKKNHLDLPKLQSFPCFTVKNNIEQYRTSYLCRVEVAS